MYDEIWARVFERVWGFRIDSVREEWIGDGCGIEEGIGECWGVEHEGLVELLPCEATTS